MVHGSQELEARDHLGVTSLFLIEEVEATEVNELTGDFEGDLIVPLVNLRHGEVIKEDDKLLVLERTVILGVLLLDFRLNGLLEVVWERVEREVDSLEGVLLLVKTALVHEDNRSLGGTGTTNKKGVEETDLSSALRAHLVERTDLLNDVLGTSRVSSRDEELREDEDARLLPLDGLPVLPLTGLRVDVVVEDGLLLEIGAVGGDLGKGRAIATDTLKNLLVELLTVGSLEKTTDGPGEAEHEHLLKEIEINGLAL